MALKTKDFSVTGKSSGGGITYTYILRVIENSTNIEKNTSNITVQAILKQSYSGTAFHTWYTGVSCTINGSQIFSDYKQRSLSGTAGAVYYEWTGDIAHNDDGSKSLTVGGKIWQSEYASYSPPAMTISESSSNAMTLTTIPRASSISASDADIGSTATVIVGRNSSGFTHTIAYKFGSLSGYIGTDGNPTSSPVELSSTTIGFKLPTSFYAQIPNAKYGACTLTCQTYSGSTAIGDAQPCTFKAKAVLEDCAPEVQGTATDTNEDTLALTGNDQVLVRYMSRIECSIEVTLRNQAGSVTQKKIGGVTVAGNAYTIEQPQSGSILFEATDSRGYPGSDTVSLSVVPYVKLTNNAYVKRTDPTSGNAILTIEKGEYFKGSFGEVDNTLTVMYRIGNGEYVEIEPVIGDEGGYSVSTNLTGLEYQSTHTIEVIVADALMTIPKTITVNKGIPVFDWGQDDFCFNVPVFIKGKALLDFVIDEGSLNGWYYRKWASGKAECWKTLTVSRAFSAQWGDMYVTPIIDRQTYPVEFAEPPVENVTLHSNSYAAWLYADALEGKTTKASSAAYKLCRPAIASGEITFYLNYYVIGKYEVT